MRLTNAMITNTTLMHINRNMRQLHNAEQQVATGRRITRPSDDPIVASRALMFRTSVHENKQFQRNVDQGVAWMNMTEATFDNINSRLLFEMRTLAVRGANGDLNVDDKRTIIGEMEALFNQLGHEINQKFGGNYLFSGFRTDEPPVFHEQNNRSFIITQHFGLTDIAREMSFQRLEQPNGLGPGIDEPTTRNINVLKLAFSGLDAIPVIPGFDVREFSIADYHAYLPPANDDATGLPVLHFIRETGELVMHNETAANFPREGISVTYQKTGFQPGDINPMVYFTGREIINTSTAHIPANTQLVYNITQYFSRAAGTPVAGGFYEFELAFPPYTAGDSLPSELRASLPPGAIIDGQTVRIPARVFDTQTRVSVRYAVENPAPPPDAHPNWHIMSDTRVQGVELVRALADGGAGVTLPRDQIELNRSFDMHNQNIQYEFSPRTLITVNSLAKNVLTDKMFSDFRRFFEFANAIQLNTREDLQQHFSRMSEDELNAQFVRLGDDVSCIESAVQAQLVMEGQMARNALHRQFSNMLFLIDRHADNSTREHTMLGARMVRMELVQNRLEEDEVSYTLLVSDNEDVDPARAITTMYSALALFKASLRANVGIVQMSLANFLR